MTAAPLRLLVDGGDSHVAPDLGNPWPALVRWLQDSAEVQLHWLHRGRAPEPLRTSCIPFPSHRKGACAADSLLIQQVCDHHGIDVFASTGWTTPVATPTLCLVDAARLAQAQQTLGPQAECERDLALDFAQAYLCASESVHQALAARLDTRPLHGAVVAACDWTRQDMAEDQPALGRQLVALCLSMRDEARAGRWSTWFEEWRRLRRLQATVDI